MKSQNLLNTMLLLLKTAPQAARDQKIFLLKKMASNEPHDSDRYLPPDAKIELLATQCPRTGQNFLMSILANADEEFLFKELLDILKSLVKAGIAKQKIIALLVQKDNFGNNIIHFTATSETMMKALLTGCASLFGEDDLRIVLLNLAQSTNRLGENILHIAASESASAFVGICNIFKDFFKETKTLHYLFYMSNLGGNTPSNFLFQSWFEQDIIQQQYSQRNLQSLGFPDIMVLPQERTVDNMIAKLDELAKKRDWHSYLGMLNSEIFQDQTFKQWLYQYKKSHIKKQIHRDVFFNIIKQVTQIPLTEMNARSIVAFLKSDEERGVLDQLHDHEGGYEIFWHLLNDILKINHSNSLPQLVLDFLKLPCQGKNAIRYVPAYIADFKGCFVRFVSLLIELKHCGVDPNGIRNILALPRKFNLLYFNYKENAASLFVLLKERMLSEETYLKLANDDTQSAIAKIMLELPETDRRLLLTTPSLEESPLRRFLDYQEKNLVSTMTSKFFGPVSLLSMIRSQILSLNKGNALPPINSPAQAMKDLDKFFPPIMEPATSPLASAVGRNPPRKHRIIDVTSLPFVLPKDVISFTRLNQPRQ